MRRYGKASVALFVGSLVLAGGLSCLVSRAQAQYQVFAWENFETGSLSDAMEVKFDARPENLTVVPYNAPGVPANILDGIARVECGNYGLQLSTTPERRIVAAVNKLTLDRRGLGEQGRALYQADLYLPAEAEKGVNIAILAVSKPEEGQSEEQALWRSYRIGFLDGDKVFYSYTDSLKKKGAPVDYQFVRVETLNLQRPGWHRFQLIFEGQDKIICAVDGKPTSFSPIIEPTLQQLQAGIMVTTPADQPRTYYADNLSIQWAPEDIPLPDSPWVKAERSDVVMPAASPAPGGFPGAAAPSTATAGLSAAGELSWHISPEQAWEQAVQARKPILVMFYAPRAQTYLALEPILQTDPPTKQLISQFVPLRVDVNQLRGGRLAQQFAVFRVPTFVVIGPDSQERTRVTFDRSTPWPTVATELQRTLARP